MDSVAYWSTGCSTKWEISNSSPMRALNLPCPQLLRAGLLLAVIQKSNAVMRICSATECQNSETSLGRRYLNHPILLFT